MVSRPDTKKARAKRHKRVRSKISGTASCPRLCVFRSTSNITAVLRNWPKAPVRAASISKDWRNNFG